MSRNNIIILVVALLFILMIWYYSEQGIINLRKKNLANVFDIYNQGSLDTQNTEVQAGCTDPSALNYDEDATWDNGLCFYVMGCCDTNAQNYDPMADSCNIPDNNLLNCNYS